MAIMKISLLPALFVALLGMVQSPGAQEIYPSKTIRIVVPIGPGGSADLGARVIARKLSDELKQPVVVENKPGGNHVVGTSAVANAPADGYTLLWTTGGLLAASVVNKTVPFDAFKDFQPITLGGRTNAAVVVSNGVPVNDFVSFLDYAKKNPGKLNYGSTGGSVTLLFEHFMQTTGINMTAILYKSQPAIWNDLLSGQIQVMIERPSAAKAQIAGGRAKIVAVTGSPRDPDTPEIPSVSEHGFTGFSIDTWQGMFIRAGTPPERVAKVKEAMARVMASPDVRAELVKIGVVPIGSSAEELAELSRKEFALWKAVALKSNFKPE